MSKANEQEVLAQIRTLLALERTCLAEERTELAEFRTGLTIILISPPASAVVAYIFFVLSLQGFSALDLLNYAFFSILALIGTRISIHSQLRLKKIRERKKLLKAHEIKLVKSSKTASNLLSDFLITNNSDETKALLEKLVSALKGRVG